MTKRNPNRFPFLIPILPLIVAAGVACPQTGAPTLHLAPTAQARVERSGMIAQPLFLQHQGDAPYREEGPMNEGPMEEEIGGSRHARHP